MNKEYLKIAIVILFFLLLMIANNQVHAEDSPFDVLNNEDRYKSEAAAEFDVNEGDDQVAVPTAVKPSGHDVFDVMHNAPHNDTSQGTAEKAGTYYNIAKVVALNKITAKSQEFLIKVGGSAYFGNISIAVKQCWSNNDPYLPQNKILINVVESKVDEDPINIFSGWLISSNIQASALEHPSYELIAIDCHDKK